MNPIRDILIGSRLASVIEQVEKGENVDLSRALVLQALDVARIGELYVAEILEREDIADAEFAQWGDDRQGSAIWGL